ncbi:hypothetical protein NXW89_31500 [Bacteroides thetaiotaomicron]|nr:hypothetical protein [Bacteroides thetaiotaomicron]
MATYSIRMNNEEIFKGNGIGEFRVNIAEIVETGITGARILPDNTDHILCRFRFVGRSNYTCGK